MNRSKGLVAAAVAIVGALAGTLLLPDPVSAAVVLRTVSVPEPATAALVATGIAGVVLEARRRRNKRND